MKNSSDFAEQLKQILARPGFVYPGSRGYFAEVAQNMLIKGVGEAEVIAILEDIYAAGTERNRTDDAKSHITARLMGQGFDEEEAFDLTLSTIDHLSLNPLTESRDVMVPSFDVQLQQIMARPGFNKPQSGKVFADTAQQLLDRGVAGAEVIGIMNDAYTAGTEYNGSFEAGFDVAYRVMRNGFESDEAFKLTQTVVTKLEWVPKELGVEDCSSFR